MCVSVFVLGTPVFPRWSAVSFQHQFLVDMALLKTKDYVCISFSTYAYTTTHTGVQRIVWLHARADTFAESFWKKRPFNCSHDEILALGISFIRHIWFKNWTIFNDDGTIPDREVIDRLWGYDQPNEVLIMVLEREAPQSSRAHSLSRSIHCGGLGCLQCEYS